MTWLQYYSTFSQTKQQWIEIAILLNAQADPIVIFVILKLYGDRCTRSLLPTFIVDILVQLFSQSVSVYV